MSDTLSDADLEEHLGHLDGWSVVDGKLHRVFTFADFNEAFGFMVRLALVSEKMDHHPDWSNSWNTVSIDIVNHAAGGITVACVELAIAADRLA